MVALRSLDDENVPRAHVTARRGLVPVMLYDSAAIRQQMLNEQAELVRRGCCMVCGVPRDACICGEYDDDSDRRDYGDDEQATA